MPTTHPIPITLNTHQIQTKMDEYDALFDFNLDDSDSEEDVHSEEEEDEDEGNFELDEDIAARELADPKSRAKVLTRFPRLETTITTNAISGHIRRSSLHAA
jgi:hypothetical protein